MALVVAALSASTLKDGVLPNGLEGQFNALLAPLLNEEIQGLTIQIVDSPKKQGMSIECQIAYDDVPLATTLTSQFELVTFSAATQAAAQAQAAALRASQPLWFFAIPFYVQVTDPIARGITPHVVLQVFCRDGVNGDGHWQPAAGGGGDLYTNLEPMLIDIGGLEIGDTFLHQTMEQMWDALLYPTLFPVLTAPSSTFTLAEAGFREIGEVVDLNFLATFDRGTIAPAYGTSGFRSGLPNNYLYVGAGLADNPSVLLNDPQVVLGYTVLLGDQDWTNQVAYDAGEQPLDSAGGNFDAPLAAGNTVVQTETIAGVYPAFATTADIAVMTQQPLVSMIGAYIQANMVAEVEPNKQTLDLPSLVWLPITGIQFYNTVSGAWEWINGSAANSLLTFTLAPASVVHVIQGINVDYDRFTHNGPLTGARQLRFYTT